MALVRVLTKSFINNAIREEGELVEYDGKLGSNLELVDDDKPAAKAKGKKSVPAPDVGSDEQTGE